MPSSPGPNEYKRQGRRFTNRGMSILPQDALADGKYPFLLNVRSHEEGTIEPRYGEIKLTNVALPGPIHSLFRLNDSSAFAGGNTAVRILGVGGTIYGGVPGVDTYSAVDTSYSGDPLTAVIATPIQSPRPFLYLYDSVKQRKVNTNFTDYPIGLDQPNDPPTATLAAPQLTFMNTVGVATWTGYGGVTAPPSPTPTPTLDRVNTTVTQLIYDLGAVGMASVSLADFNNVTAGMTLDIGSPSPETIIVHSVHPPVAPTTIAAILYDLGTTGLCTIQPTGSFSVGQIEAALPLEIERRYRELNEPLPPRVTVTRTVDFPVDSLVLLNGVEVVRILSVAIGPDGVQSFRVNVAGTYSAGQSISGLSSFRAYFNTTKSVGDPAVALALEVTVTPPTTDAVVGGVQAPFTGPIRNWAYAGTRATQPEDIIRFGIKVSDLGFVTAVRMVLDLSPTGPAFLRDYYMYEWRPSDLVDAIQSASETTAGLIADSQAQAVQQGQVDSLYADQYGQAPKNIFGVVNTALNQATISLRQQIIAARNQAAIDGVVSLGAGLSRQLALGNDAWMTLECRVGDLTRVGTDTTLTLQVMQNVALYVQLEGTTNAVDVQFSDGYLIGGYGPDTGTIMPPYVYRYSYRSTITGERSNPSPPMRAGVDPRRGLVDLAVLPSTDPQADEIDFWRFGGALARWTYVGTIPNDASASPFVNSFGDDRADRQIDGGQEIRTDLYQPWPTSDLPRSGTVNVAGTAVQWVSGDLFDLDWAADSAIIINGIATQLYRSPTSTTFLEVVDNCGSGSAVPFSLPSPTLLHQDLPYAFGGFINDVWFTFAVGDPDDPGVLHWTHGNDPDASSDVNTLYVSTADEPLLAGYVDDGIPYVFSTKREYRILPSGQGFIAQETNCQRGMWSPWFGCKHPDGGWFFGAKDGIYYTRGGGVAESLLDPDLRPLFPQEGTSPVAVRNLNPIDFAQTDRLRLSFVDQVLYFDYLDTEGESHSLVYEPLYQRWTPDLYAVGVTVRNGEGGPQVHDHIMASIDGNLRQMQETALTDVGTTGDLTPFDWAVWTPWMNGDDPRAWKQWGDAILDFNPAGSLNGVTVTPVLDNGNTALAPQIVGAGGIVRQTYLVDISQGIGQYSRNCGLWIQGRCEVCDTQRPLLFLWEHSYLWKGTSVGNRATDWEDLGYKGAKYIQGVVLRANTFGLQKVLEVQFDGPNAAPQLALQLPIFHDGEQSIAYPFEDTGWNPFIGELVRLRGLDAVEWVLLDWRFIWEPAPEAATQWETQDTTFDLPGFMSARDIVSAYDSVAPVELTVWHDDRDVLYTLPDTGGEYKRIYTPLRAEKGKSVKWQWTSTVPFRLYKRDCSVRVQGWGLPGGYMVVNPFGGPSREDGAGI